MNYNDNAWNFEDLQEYMGAQWCGCGAKFGANLLPDSLCSSGRPQPRPPVLPGYSAGPHAFDTYTANAFPNIGTDYPMAWQLPDSNCSLDPMDSRVWTPPAPTIHSGRQNPYSSWTYAPGPNK